MNTTRSAGGSLIDANRTPTVIIRTLGVFQVICDGMPVPGEAWPSNQAQDLLKILVARRTATSRRQLVELLWPQISPAKAGNRLSMLLSRLHNLLTAHASAGPLASDSTVVWLDRTRVHVDVEQFLTDAAAAVAAHAAGQPDAATQLRAALAAYTGDFLQGETPQHWAISLAQEVRTTHRGLLRALATGATARR